MGFEQKTESSKTPADTITGRDLEDMLNKGVKSSDTEERLNQFVRWRIQEYTLNKWETLSAIFADDFQQFAREDFETLGKTNISALRDCLRKNGVYVKKARGYSIAQALADVVQEDIPWPPDDEGRPPPKQQHHYPPQQQLYSPQQHPIQPQQPYRPENTAPLPPQPPYQPENPAPILPPAPNYGPNYRIPHQLPSPHQVIQDFGIRQNHGHSKELTTLAKLYTNEEKYGGSPTESLVDEGTSFQAARWLTNMTASHTWDMLRLCWIDVYVGPPDVIVHDAGTNFDSTEFRQNARTLSIQTKCVPVEAANSIGLVERYHTPLRRAYLIITAELENQGIGKEIRLQMAVKAVNDTAGYNGLVPTLLVFGTFPRITNDDAPTLSTTERAKAINVAMAEVAKLHAKRQVNDALHQRNGPQTMRMHDTPIGSPVLVWRTHQKKWTGPYKLLATSRETCTVELSSGPTDFRVTIVKPYLQEPEQSDTPIEPHEEPQRPQKPDPQEQDQDTQPEDTSLRRDQDTQPEDAPPRRNPPRYRQPPTRFQNMADITVYMSRPTPPPTNFQASRLKELNGLLEKGVFEILDTQNIPAGAQIFGSRFVDQIKNEGTEKAFEKSRLVVQAFNDSEKRGILTQAPTIQRASQRLIIALSLAIPELSLYLRDITQAYTQSRSELARDVFIFAPAEMGLPTRTVLRVILPLYGIAESGTHWFQTYHKHHVEKLGMIPSTFDTCLLFNNNMTAIVGLQTDDSLIADTTEFMEVESRELHAAGLVARPCERLTPEQSLEFNGFVITLGDNIRISQLKQAKKIQLLSKSFTKEQYIAQRARGAYIATVSQPQAAFALHDSTDAGERSP